MPAHSETQHLPYTPEQIFNLVADVERYPQFLPWCRAARVLERRENEMLAELVISFKGLTERYTSRVRLTPFEAIDVEMVEGPFDHLVNRWRFTPEPGGGLPTPERSSGFAQAGTRIDFFLDFRFRSRLLGTLIGPLFARATDKMGEAFRKRAEEMYGDS